MQLSRSLILEVCLAPHGRAIHIGTSRTWRRDSEDVRSRQDRRRVRASYCPRTLKIIKPWNPWPSARDVMWGWNGLRVMVAFELSAWEPGFPVQYRSGFRIRKLLPDWARSGLRTCLRSTRIYGTRPSTPSLLDHRPRMITRAVALAVAPEPFRKGFSH